MKTELAKVKDLYSKLVFILSKEQKLYAILVLVMSLIAALLELLGVSVIIPIINMILSPEVIANKWYIKPFADAFHLDTTLQITILICVMAILVYTIKNLYFILFNWVAYKYSYKVNRELSSRILRAYMRQGYIFFVNNNSARLLQGIGADVSSVYSILNLLFNMVTKLLTVACIGIYILIESTQLALILMALAAVCLIFIQLIFRKSMRENGAKRRELSWQCTKTSIEAIQGNKEILVMNKQDYFVDNFKEMMAKSNRVSVKVDMGAVIPVYIIEMICILGLLISVVIEMSAGVDANIMVTQLSAIAVAAFRIMPALGVISSGINSITMSTTQLQNAYDTLKEVYELEKTDEFRREIIESNAGIEFKKDLVLKDIVYKYPSGKDNVLNNLNLAINKGESIGLIGPSGAGKTTLVDVILSLLVPSSGGIYLDGTNVCDLGPEWNRIVGYVPQMVYIVDDTIRHNIAFGEKVSDIDDAVVWNALKMAQLDTFVKDLPDGLDTIVGEHGIKFSGGQRQRLAIARALYRNPDILVLDEATAALDTETEKAVMDSIEALQGIKTLLIVAHRLTTVKKCDKIYEIKNGVATLKTDEEIFGE